MNAAPLIVPEDMQVTRIVPTAQATSSAIVSAMWESDGVLVRVYLADETESHCHDDGSTPLGQQLQDWQAAGNVIAPHALPPISPYEVDQERDRRNHLGEQLTLRTGKIVNVATATREDYDNINYASDTALTLIAKTIPALSNDADAITPTAPAPNIMTFRDFYRLPVDVTYHEMAEISVLVTNNVNAVNQAAHLLKDMDPIPRDYQDDKYWPTDIPRPPLSPV